MSRLLAAAALLLPCIGSAAPCPARSSWPTAEWPSRLEATAAAKANEIRALEDYAFTLTGKDDERLGLRTDGLLIIKGGVLIYERYGRGFGPANRHISWSVAKSVSSALAGVAVRKGALTLDDSICQHLPAYEGQDVCRVKVEHVLTMSSGLLWQEETEGSAPYQQSSPIAMFFGVGHRDMLDFYLRHPLVFEPGSRFRYSTGDSMVLATVVKRAMEGAGLGKEAAWTELFDKLGMDAVLEEDAKGTVLGGSHLFATPRDYAKLGFLYLNDGCWMGERLLPEGWVQASTTPSKAFRAGTTKAQTTPNGYSWWMNQALPERQITQKPWPDTPDDAYLASGHWGQQILVVPSLDLIVVRTGDDRKGSLSTNELFKRAVEVAR